MNLIITNEMLIWKPSISVGPFFLGGNLSDLIQKYNLEIVKDETNKSDSWQTFKVKDREDIRIYSESLKIESVSCDKYCYYKNSNLIGLSIQDLNNILNTKEDKVDEIDLDEGIYKVYEYESYSCQVWVSCEKIISIICSDYLERVKNSPPEDK